MNESSWLAAGLPVDIKCRGETSIQMKPAPFPPPKPKKDPAAPDTTEPAPGGPY
jgi:hypothetical protein